MEENLVYTAPDRSPAERRRLGRATFRNLALCTIDFLRIPLMSRAEIVALFDERGREHLDRALARGKGVILLTGHLGNWELACPFLAAFGYPMYAYAEDTANRTDLFRTYEPYRGATGMTMIPLSQGALIGCRVLQQGSVLGLVCDRVIAGRGQVVDFCGGRRGLPIGPAVLARRSGATILLSHFTLNPAGPRRYLAEIEPFVDLDCQRGDYRQLAQAIADQLTRMVRDHPDQWFVFQPQWLTRDPRGS